jgi:hypothetical protein
MYREGEAAQQANSIERTREGRGDPSEFGRIRNASIRRRKQEMRSIPLLCNKQKTEGKKPNVWGRSPVLLFRGT